MRDDTLDSLLTAAIDSGDSAILLIIADYLEETDHPAAVWWRKAILPTTTLTRDGVLHDALVIYETSTLWTTIRLREELGLYRPGATDLMQRIDGIRLYNILRM